MKRTNLILIVFALVTLSANAQHISEQEAMERALQYMSSGNTSIRMAAPVRGGGAELNPAPVGAESIYAFNLKGSGYIIASADSRALPVLGYSDSGSIDWEQMPENMRAWLMQYDEAIATLGDRMDFKDGNLINNGAPNRTDTRAGKAPVEPLIKTHWAQGAPYNDQCPLYEGIETGLHGKRCATGCLATAMAQVLNYHQWPKTLPNGLPAYETIDDCSDENLTWHIDSLPPVTFDWDNMLDDYEAVNPDTKKTEDVGTEVERQAVATLMRYCGQAVKMQYGATLGSAAAEEMCYYAMLNYFSYPAVTYLERNEQYGIDEWEEIIYNELYAGRPVMYVGTIPGDGAHAFVCDGYDGRGLFHINWGWNGEDDGYYSLSVLNAYESSGANGDNELGFTSLQTAFIYIDPKMEKQPAPKSRQPEFYQSEEIYVWENEVLFVYSYQGETDTIIDKALGTIDENGRLTPLFMVPDYDSILYRSNSNVVFFEIDSALFQPGDSITLYPMMRFRKPGEEWQIVPPLFSNIVVGRTDGGLFFIHTPDILMGLKINGGAITKGSGRVGEPCNLTVYVSNQTVKDYNYDLAICPYYIAQIHGNDTLYFDEGICGKWMRNSSHIKAWQDGENTFSFTPEFTGLVEFFYYIYLHNDVRLYNVFTLTLDNDTLVNYEKHIEKKNNYVFEGNKCFFTVELRDTTGNGVPDYVIPSDSIVLNMRYYYNDEMIRDTIIKDEIREFLAALPENGGSSFNCRMMIDVSKPGYYTLESYYGDLRNGTISSKVGKTKYYLRISEPTSIKPVHNDTSPGSYQDLMGRPIIDIPKQDGLYINDGRKVLIRVSH